MIQFECGGLSQSCRQLTIAQAERRGLECPTKAEQIEHRMARRTSDKLSSALDS